MSAVLPSLGCCNPCNPCPTSAIVNIPGPPGTGTPGSDGQDGTDGTNGLNAFTTTTAPFPMPPINASEIVNVVDNSWVVVGENIFIEGAGYFLVVSKPSTTSIGIENIGGDNVAAGTLIDSGAEVSPAGPAGPSGAVLMPGIFVADTIADARAIPTDPTNRFLFLIGRDDITDALGGDFYWSNTSSAPDDNGNNVIEPSDLPATGRWLKRGP